jgi:large subunit ribosomal protein L22
MEVVATAKWIRTTARKARLVTATIEGLPVAEALVVLRFTPRAAARDVANVIKSAAANAEHNYNLDASTLRVARVEVEAAAIIKRFRPKPRGMSGSIFKRTAHLRAFVTDDEPSPRHRVRSKIRMPRTVVTAPAAGPARETPATRRRRTASAAAASASTESPTAPERAAPRRRRGATPAATAAAETPAGTTEDTAPVSATEAPATDAAEEAAATTAEPATEPDEGDKG